jgi:hypothetical protein
MNDVIPYNVSYDPLAQSQVPGWSYYNPWQGAPGGMIGQQFAAMAGQSLMGQQGYMPMGMGYQGGLYNNIQMQMFSASHMKAMQTASQQDMNILMSTQRGMASMAGVKIGEAEEKALGEFNSYLLKAAPYVDPRTLDVLSGGRSAVNMAHFMHLGGRVRRDAVTGMRGMSGDTAAHVAQGAYKNYFEDANYGMRTAGLTSMQMGQMFDELSRRGMMAPIGTQRERVVAGLMDADQRGIDVGSILQNNGINAGRFTGGGAESMLKGLNDSEINKLSKNTDVQHGMRSVDAKRITDTLDKYKGAIAAVQEIFGENGRPNAPMRELMNALEQLTQNGMQQLQPGRTEMVVRNMYNAAKAAGVDMATVTGMMQAAGQQTNEMGRNPLFATQMTTGGLVFGAAYNDAGLGANPAWGLQTQKQMIGSHMAATGRAINSELANRVATMFRLRDRVGSMGGRSGQILKDIESGVMDGRLADMGYGAFRDMVAGDTGLSTNQIETALQHRQQNEEFIYNNNLGGIINRYAQPHEMDRKVLGMAGESQANAMTRKLLGKGNFSGLNTRLSQNLTASWRSMNATVMTNGKARTISASRDLYDYLERTAKNDPGSDEAKLYGKLKGMSEADRNRELNMYAENAWGEAEQNYMEDYGGEPLINVMLRQSAAAGLATDKAGAEVKLKSALEARSAGIFSGGSPLFNLIKNIQQAGENPNQATLTDVLAKSLGGIGKKELAGKLASDLIALDKAQDKLKEMHDSAPQAAERGKEAENALEEQSNIQMRVIEDMKKKIQSFMDENGLTQTLGSLIDEEKGGPGSNETAMNFPGCTINITAPEGTLTLKNAKGTAVAKNETRRGGAVATA